MQKPELYDTLYRTFTDDDLAGKTTLNNYNIIGQIRNEHTMFTSPKILNFMLQKKFKWILNNSFSFDVAQNLKETIVDTFIRMRLKEGFKCLFQSNKFAIFTIQLTMFDSGDIVSQYETSLNSSKIIRADEMKDEIRRHSAKNLTTFKNGSSQMCTFVYVIRFFSNWNWPYAASQQKATGMSTSENAQNNGLLNVVANNNNNNNSQGLFYLDNAKRYDETFHEIGPAKKKEDAQTNATSLDMNELEVSFTTEIYVEAVDGIYREKKSTNLSNSTFNLSSKKIMREKLRYLRNFRNLTNSEIINLIYLTDLKCFSSLQSSYALFLSKTNPITNLTGLLNVFTTTSNDFQPQQYFHSSSNLINIYEYDCNYFECIRILPDLNIIPKASLIKLNKNNKMSSVRSTYLINRIKLNKNIGRQATPGGLYK